MSKDTGGSAFPHPQVNLDDAGLIFLPNSSGMTLRDWFAGQALCGMTQNAVHADTITRASEYAKRAYLIADAMIIAGGQNHG